MNRIPNLADFWPPLVGGLVAIAGAVLIRTLTGTRLLAEVTLDAMISVLPGEDFSSLLGVFGPYGKALFFLSVLVAQIVVYIAIWVQAQRLAGSQGSNLRLPLGAGLAVTVVFLGAAVVLIAATTATLGRDTGWLDFAMVTALLSGVYASVAGLQSMARVEADPYAASDSRRKLLTRIPGVALGALALFVIGRALNDASEGGVQRSRSGEPSPEVTPTGEFYVISKNLFDPDPDGATWRLQVGGATERTVVLNYDDMRAMPSQEQYTTMQCISNEVGGELIGNALWRGVPMRDVIEIAGPLAGAKHVFMRCVDEYTDSIPLDFAMRPQTLLAYEMNGEPLTSKHGYPLRLLTPGKYGMKHPKWIIEIELREDEQLGFWQQRGWSQEATMNTTVKVDVPGRNRTLDPGSFLVQGVAFSGDRGISKVEVSLDNGSTWAEATLKPPLSSYTWVLWEYEVPELAEGEHVVLARATDGTGAIQKDGFYDPFPDGAAAYHDVPFRIQSGNA